MKLSHQDDHKTEVTKLADSGHAVVVIGVDIIQTVVMAYRVPLFTQLAARSDLDIAVQCSPRDVAGATSVPMPLSGYHCDRSIVPLLPRFRLGWQCGLRLVKARRRGDVLVIGGDIRCVLSLLWLTLRARMRGVRVVWWSQGWSATSTPGKLRLKMHLMRCVADVALLYTPACVALFRARGFPAHRLFCTNNTIDLVPIQQARGRWTPEGLRAFAAREGVAGKQVLLFTSMLTPKTRLDLVITALAQPCLRNQECLLVVIGDGRMRPQFEAAAAAQGVADRVRWLGAILDQDALAPWFLSARALVYPGSIGLTIIHAFGYGLPVITHGNRWHQMPEFDALREGENGLTFAEGDAGDLARVVARLLDDPALRDRLGRCARDTVEQHYTMPQMADNFAAAIHAASAFARRS